MKKSLFTLLVLMLFGSVYAQSYTSYYRNLPIWHPNWHAGTATFMGQVYINGAPNDNLAIELGAYDVQDPENIHVTGAQFGLMESGGVQYEHPVYFISVSGEPNDQIIFKLYDHEAEAELEYECAEVYIWEDNGGDVSGTWIWHFYTPKEMVFAGLSLTDNLWANPENWTAGGEFVGRLPYAGENVSIEAPCLVDMEAVAATITVTSGNSLTIDEGGALAGELTIKDGAQFFAPDGYEITATVEKEIQPYSSNYGNWYFISAPVQDFTDYEAAGMLVNDYDLYTFDQTYAGEVEEDPDNGEWRNYKYALSNGDDLEPEYNAYLYANSEFTILSFTGSLFTDESVSYKKLPFSGDADDDTKGFNLVGNPYASNALATRGSKTSGFYYMNEEGRQDVIAVDDESIVVAPATALFVVATAKNNNNASIEFVPTEEEAIARGGNAHVNVELFANGVLQDRAYVRMYESEDLVKFSLSNRGAKLFIPQNGKKYAAVYAGEAKVMPVNFTTTEKGTYTLSVNVENTACSYLHLIDNLTGADIDLLRTSTYTFDATGREYASRFKLVFAENATNEIVDNFAFVSNGELVIINSGDATLQMMDATGRTLSVENINGSYSKSLNLSAGVYVVRLSNGSDVKTQKIVVK